MTHCPSDPKAPLPRLSRREYLGFYVSCAAWTLFFGGLAGILVDSLIVVPPVFNWISYALVILGALLFSASVVLRSPPPPPFLAPLPDPWEDVKRDA